MSTPPSQEPKASPFNSSFWLALGSSILAGVLSASVAVAVMRRDLDDTLVWRREAQVWMAAKEREVSDLRQNAAVDKTSNDLKLKALQDGVNNIQQALMGRSGVIAPATGRQPYP